MAKSEQLNSAATGYFISQLFGGKGPLFGDSSSSTKSRKKGVAVTAEELANNEIMKDLQHERNKNFESHKTNEGVRAYKETGEIARGWGNVSSHAAGGARTSFFKPESTITKGQQWTQNDAAAKIKALGPTPLASLSAGEKGNKRTSNPDYQKFMGKVDFIHQEAGLAPGTIKPEPVKLTTRAPKSSVSPKPAGSKTSAIKPTKSGVNKSSGKAK